MHTGKQKQMNASYQASLVNRHIRRFTGLPLTTLWARVLTVASREQKKNRLLSNGADLHEVRLSVQDMTADRLLPLAGDRAWRPADSRGVSLPTTGTALPGMVVIRC